MNIDPYSPACPINDTVYPNGQMQYGSNGMPIRLELAIRLMVAMAANMNTEWEEDAEAALRGADALIEAYNQSQP